MRASVISPGKERRRSRRQKVAKNLVELEWWDGHNAGQAIASVLDVSRGGLRLASEDGPRTGQPVWLRFGAEARPGSDPEPGRPWISADVVWSDGSEAGIAFRGPCPDDLYLGLTLGIRLDGLLGVGLMA